MNAPLEYRGTGRTTLQMQEAPVGAVFIVGHSSELHYARRLAERLGRTDLDLRTVMYLENGYWHGRELTGLVLDHHVPEMLTDDQWYGYHAARYMVRK